MGRKVKGRLKNFVMWAVIALIVFLSALNVILTVHTSNENSKSVEEKIQIIKDMIRKEPEIIKEIRGLDGYTPVKGVDYFDGQKGDTGDQGLKGDTGETGKTGQKGEDGQNGKDAYFDIRCNQNRNRWEVKFSPEDSWQVLNGKSIKCTINSIFNIEVE